MRTLALAVAKQHYYVEMAKKWISSTYHYLVLIVSILLHIHSNPSNTGPVKFSRIDLHANL